MSRLTRDGTTELISRDQILRRERRQRNIHFPCSADHEQDWQPYPVDLYSGICMVITYDMLQSMDQPDKIANLARGQLNRENEYFSVAVRV